MTSPGHLPTSPVRERGIAMVTTLLVLMLVSALLMGFTTLVMSDLRSRFIDRDRGQAFYAASGGIEKLTCDIGNLFLINVTPSASQVTALTAPGSKPAISGVTFTSTSAPAGLPASQLTTYHCKPPKTVSTVGASGYTITFCANAAGNPTVSDDPTTITSGPYDGLIAQQTPYQLDVTARTSTGGDVHLVRTVEAVAIPAFQFGMFSTVDLSLFASPSFGFGGRVHSNGNLFLAQGDASTLTLADKVTAVGEVVRQRLQNGVAVTVVHNGTVNMAKSAGTYRSLLVSEGSVVDGVTSALNEPLWHTTSLSTYNSWIRNGRTGAKALVLPLVPVGGSNADLVRRPVAGEDTTNPTLYGGRLYSKASLRILLSDRAADITGLPAVTGTAPVQLDGDWLTTPPNNGTVYGPVSSTRPPIARAPAPLTTTVSASGSTVNNIKVSAAGIALFRPVMTLSLGATTETVTCTAKDAANNRFTGCTVATAVAAAATLSAGPGISVVTTTATTAGTAATIKLPSGGTAAFMPAPFWIGGSLVTCTGWDATPQFTGCLAATAPASGAVLTSSVLSSAGTGTIGGYIKIDRQDGDGTWHDVTMEILNYGVGGKNVGGTICADPTPNAVIRIQRLRSNSGGASATANGGGCSYNTDTTGAKDATAWWPNTLYDAREALQRDSSYPGAATMTLGGVMHYVSIDAGNLALWFKASGAYATGSGATARTDNGGYTVYFSDRRNNRKSDGTESGEYGFEDVVNPSAVNGAPNGSLDPGEDVNGNGTLETYGGTPNFNGAVGATPPGAVAPLDAAARPTTGLTAGQAQVNRAIIFRRALKLVNGATLAPTIAGLTIASENPVYIEKNWNANGTFVGTHAATSVIADSVTLLSNQWTDAISYTQPYAPGSRARTAGAWYRVAIAAGKGPAFGQPTGTANDFGTDGGAHNLLRSLESGNTVNYLGSLATFFYSRQAVGTYKCCTTVFSAPTRSYAFDVDFLDPAKLPPNTPVFADMNSVGFSQDLRPGR